MGRLRINSLYITHRDDMMLMLPKIQNGWDMAHRFASLVECLFFPCFLLLLKTFLLLLLLKTFRFFLLLLKTFRFFPLLLKTFRFFPLLLKTFLLLLLCLETVLV